MTDKIDSVVLNRWLGLPIFLFIMYVMFLFTQNFGAAFIDFFDILVGGVFVDGLGEFMSSVGAPDWLMCLLPMDSEVVFKPYATFIPPIFFLFLFLAFLEDFGYMARAAFVMDRLCVRLGCREGFCSLADWIWMQRRPSWQRVRWIEQVIESLPS